MGRLRARLTYANLMADGRGVHSSGWGLLRGFQAANEQRRHKAILEQGGVSQTGQPEVGETAVVSAGSGVSGARMPSSGLYVVQFIVPRRYRLGLAVPMTHRLTRPFTEYLLLG